MCPGRKASGNLPWGPLSPSGASFPWRPMGERRASHCTDGETPVPSTVPGATCPALGCLQDARPSPHHGPPKELPVPHQAEELGPSAPSNKHPLPWPHPPMYLPSTLCPLPSALHALHHDPSATGPLAKPQPLLLRPTSPTSTLPSPFRAASKATGSVPLREARGPPHSCSSCRNSFLRHPLTLSTRRDALGPGPHPVRRPHRDLCLGLLLP